MISFAHFASPDGSIPRSLRQLHETLFYASRMRTNLPPRRYLLLLPFSYEESVRNR
jgi:hypothetical protein